MCEVRWWGRGSTRRGAAGAHPGGLVELQALDPGPPPHRRGRTGGVAQSEEEASARERAEITSCSLSLSDYLLVSTPRRQVSCSDNQHSATNMHGRPSSLWPGGKHRRFLDCVDCSSVRLSGGSAICRKARRDIYWQAPRSRAHTSREGMAALHEDDGGEPVECGKPQQLPGCALEPRDLCARLDQSRSPLAANCGATDSLLKCSRCHTAWFCGVKCQKARSGVWSSLVVLEASAWLSTPWVDPASLNSARAAPAAARRRRRRPTGPSTGRNASATSLPT